MVAPRSRSDTPRPATVAAEQLDRSLSRVFDALPRHRATRAKLVDNVRQIHRLRVACRRAVSVLDVFCPLIKRGWRTVKRWLQDVRRSAGPLRDLDVFIAQLGQCDLPADLKKALENQMSAQRKRLDKEFRHTVRSRLRDHSRKSLLKKIRWRNDRQFGSLSEFSTTAIGELQTQLEIALQTPQPDFKQLHRIRIAAKRLRYARELLLEQAAAKRANREVLRMQELLGTLNDHLGAQARYQMLVAHLPANEWGALVAGEIVAHHRQAVALREQFCRWIRRRKRTKLPRGSDHGFSSRK